MAESSSDDDFKAKLEGSFGLRRQPRVRLREGRIDLYHYLGHRKTKRAAFRAARERRDTHGERQPLRVWQVGAYCWHYGYRQERLGGIMTHRRTNGYRGPNRLRTSN